MFQNSGCFFSIWLKISQKQMRITFMFTIREVPCKIAQFIPRHGLNPPRLEKDISTDFFAAYGSEK